MQSRRDEHDIPANEQEVPLRIYRRLRHDISGIVATLDVAIPNFIIYHASHLRRRQCASFADAKADAGLRTYFLARYHFLGHAALLRDFFCQPALFT